MATKSSTRDATQVRQRPAARQADRERAARIRDALDAAALSAFVCARPRNVLLLSGYWPVVGTTCVVAGRHQTVLVVPADEAALAERVATAPLVTFEPGSLARLETVSEAIEGALGRALALAEVGQGPVGVETGAGFEPWPYVGMHSYGPQLATALRDRFGVRAVRADRLLRRLAALMTPAEIARVAEACRIAGRAFETGARALVAGLTEREAAARFWATLATDAGAGEGTPRAGGFVFCMSGPNAAQAFGAFAQSTYRVLEPGDLVLVHCNSFLDGYWTDITRTYCLAPVPDRVRQMHDAVFAARAAALAATRPGARGAEVDAAARRVMVERGFGPAFKHSTGHGVGFAAIDHNAPPRLHPRSPDVLEVGSVFNLEPGIYLEGYGGMRHCDVVVLDHDGARVLTTFQSDPKVHEVS